MLQWLATITESILSIGVLGILLSMIVEGTGLPFPGDMLLAFYGFEAFKGRFHLTVVIAMSISGYLIGTVCSYLLSRHFGERLFQQLHRLPFISQANVRHTAQLMHRYGPIILAPGRFFPGLRSISSYAAGLSNLEFLPFLFYTIIGTTLWCTATVLLGYWFGEHIQEIMHMVQTYMMYISGAVIVGFAVFIWYRYNRGRTT